MKKITKALLLVSATLSFISISYAGNPLEVSLINKTSLSYNPQEGSNLNMVTVNPFSKDELFNGELLTEPRQYYITYVDTKTGNGFKFRFYSVNGAVSKYFCSTLTPRIKCTVNFTGSHLTVIIDHRD
jgi:hypothetical protein